MDLSLVQLKQPNVLSVQAVYSRCSKVKSAFRSNTSSIAGCQKLRFGLQPLTLTYRAALMRLCDAIRPLTIPI